MSKKIKKYYTNVYQISQMKAGDIFEVWELPFYETGDIEVLVQEKDFIVKTGEFGILPPTAELIIDYE